MSTRQFKCTIKKMFKGCPKPDGWFGCFAHIRGEEDDIRLTGKSPLALSDGLQLNVVAEQNPMTNISQLIFRSSQKQPKD